jgi:hypothetical protein
LKEQADDQGVRIEHDPIGDKEVPADAHYGVHTAGAVENLAITGSVIAQRPELITALAAVEQAAALANSDLAPPAPNRSRTRQPQPTRSPGLDRRTRHRRRTHARTVPRRRPPHGEQTATRR